MRPDKVGHTPTELLSYAFNFRFSLREGKGGAHRDRDATCLLILIWVRSLEPNSIEPTERGSEYY